MSDQEREFHAFLITEDCLPIPELALFEPLALARGRAIFRLSVMDTS